jgi:TfuA protein
MSDAVVYLGPTLAVATARSLLDATYLPPIRRGDLVKLGDEIKTVGIVDGVFHHSLAVSPKEVVTLLDRGVRVYGSSSIGALRAAETHMHGMIGIGVVFEMYRDLEIDADDEVAVAYDPSTDRTISEPLVNIRLALKCAIEERVISSAEACRIISAMKEIYYPSRCWQLVISMSPALASFLKPGRFNQKRDDAILLLRTMAREVAA